MEITRTFHTVGQGAFYSEIIEINEKQFVVVYDCGSYTLGSKSLDPSKNQKLKNKINSDLKTRDVDILFISHFDTDHINGCQFLNPKIVIIPFLSPEQINILSVINTISEGEISIDVIRNPENYFPNAHIIKIRPTEELNSNSDEVSEVIDLNSEDPLSELTKQNELDSGIPIKIQSDFKLWEYVPFNPNWKKFFEDFKQAVNNDEDLDYTLLTNIDNGAYVIKHIKELRTIYDNLKGSKNSHSLVLYSGPLCYSELSQLFIPQIAYENLWTDLYKIFDPYDWMEFWDDLLAHKSGCIYFGDITLYNKLIQNYYNFLEKTKRKQNVGTIQIPHHGAKSSNGHLCVDNSFLCVISVGEQNDYGHPSTYIINSIMKKRSLLRLVTENCRSILIQTFLLI